MYNESGLVDFSHDIELKRLFAIFRETISKRPHEMFF